MGLESSRVGAATVAALVGAAMTWFVVAFGRPALVTIVPLLLLGTLLRGDRRFRAGWLFLGAGGTALLFAGSAQARCLSAGSGAISCTPPDISAFVGIAAALVGLGVLLLMLPLALASGERNAQRRRH